MEKERSHWSSLLPKRLSRRQLLRGGAIGSLGLAAALVLGCGESQDPELPANVNSSDHVPAKSGMAEPVREKSAPKTIIQTIVYMRQKAKESQNENVSERVQRLEKYYLGGYIQLRDRLRDSEVADIELVGGSPSSSMSYLNILVNREALTNPAFSEADIALHLFQKTILLEDLTRERLHGGQAGVSATELAELELQAWLITRDEAVPIFGKDARSSLFKGAYVQCLDAGRCQP